MNGENGEMGRTSVTGQHTELLIIERNDSSRRSRAKLRAEEVTDIIGQFGVWQKFYFAVLTFVCGVTALPALSMTFLAPSVPFRCRMDENVSCSINNSYPCEQWDFDHSVYRNTLTEKLQLVCGQSWLVSLSNSINMAGDVLAAIFLGYLADRFGRRPVVMGAVVPAILSNVLILLTTNVYVFLCAKFLVGMSGFSAFTVSFVLLMEMVGEKYRPLLGIAVEFGWAVAYITLPGVAWLLRDWFQIQLFITCFVGCLVLLWCLIPESPRWLLLQGRVDEAESIVRKALQWNGLKQNDLTAQLYHISNSMRESTRQQNHLTIIDLVRTPGLRKHTAILAAYWLVNGFVFYGISLNTEIFGGNTFLNFFLFGLVEFPAYALAIPLVNYAGRKWPLLIYMLGAGISCMLTIPFQGPESHSALVTMVCIGKFFIASSFATIYPYTAEVYPTAVRTIGIGTCNFFARVATVLAPFVNEMASASHLWVSLSVFGIMAIISGASVVLLPETKGLNLPETLLDGESLRPRSQEQQSRN